MTVAVKAPVQVDFSTLLLECLAHVDGEFVSLGYDDATGFRTAVMTPAEAVAAAAQLPATANSYFGVNPVAGPARKNAGRGTASDVTRLAALFADIDVKPGACPSLDVARAIVAEVGIIIGTRPTVLVESGGGLHAYWPVTDCPIAEARPLLKRWGRLVAAVADRFDVAVDNVYDLTRMLRLPGSVNNKTDQPRPVIAYADTGGPLDAVEVAERLDEWGIFEIPEDSSAADQTEVSTPDEWRWAERTCPYVATMVAAFRTDSPKKGKGRSPWLISCKVRLNCAKRLGCITEADYLQAETNLEQRFAEVLADPRFDTPRTVKKFEHRDTKRAAVKRVAAKTDEQCRAELGNHTHPGAAVTEVDAGELAPDTGDTPDAEPTTWEPVDLGPWLSGEHVSPKPAVGISRTDGQKLLYSGREHTVFGETEVGKSWFAGESAAVEIRMGRDVVYVHYEEGDPASTIERLRVLGVTPAQIARHLRFVAPARPVRGDWLKPLLDPPPVLVIHDGVNEAMSLHGDDTNQTDGAATFRRTIIKPFLAVGATSLSCDHVVKNSDVRGRYAIGSAHKINAIDGAAFLMENIEPFGRGLRGASAVYVTKDRPGQLRAHGRPVPGVAGKTLIGVLTVDATGDSPDFLTFHPPREKDAQESGVGPTLADEIYRVLVALPDHTAKSGRDLRAAMRDAGLKFSTDSALAAFDDLVFQGRVKEIPGRHKAIGYRAVVADSGVPQESPGHGVPSTVPFGVPPIESGTPEHSPVSVPRNTPEHSGTLEGKPQSPVCRSCGRTLTPAQESRGFCYLAECSIAAKSVSI